MKIVTMQTVIAVAEERLKVAQDRFTRRKQQWQTPGQAPESLEEQVNLLAQHLVEAYELIFLSEQQLAHLVIKLRGMEARLDDLDVRTPLED